MGAYTISGRTTLTTATANAPLAMLLKPAAGVLARVNEVGIFLASAVASTMGIARSTTATTTPTSLGTPERLNNKDPNSSAVSAVAWTTVGAATGMPIKRMTLPATIGVGFIWTWDPSDPLLVGDQVSAATGELMLINLVAVTAGVFDYYVNWKE